MALNYVAIGSNFYEFNHVNFSLEFAHTMLKSERLILWCNWLVKWIKSRRLNFGGAKP